MRRQQRAVEDTGFARGHSVARLLGIAIPLAMFALTLVGLVDRRDPYSANHSRHVAMLSASIARTMQLAPHLVETARVAGEIFGPCAAAGLYRRAAFLEVGGFDASYFCYFEDVDLAFRLRLRGYRSRYVPEAVVHHVGSALSGYRSDFAVFHGHRNLVWTFFKDMPTPLLALYLPHHLAMNLAAVLVAARRGQGPVALKAKAAAIRGLPRVLRARRSAQRSRIAGALEVRAAMVRGLRAFGLGRKR